MSRDFPNAGANRISMGDPTQFDAEPISFFAWIFAEGYASGEQHVISKWTGSFQFWMGKNTTAGRLVTGVGAGSAGTTEAPNETGTHSLNVWYAYGYTKVSTGASGLRGYRNGARVIDFTSTKTIGPTATGMCIGAHNGGGSAWNGLIAECAGWDAALTDAEHASLAAGVSPNLIRRESLKFYIPLFGDSPERDYSGTGLHGTVVGSPAVATRNPPCCPMVLG